MLRLSDLGSLPPTLTTEQAAEVFGCGVDHLWALARAGQAPVEPLRLGRKLVWPTALVLRAVGLDPGPPGESEPAGLSVVRPAG